MMDGKRSSIHAKRVISFMEDSKILNDKFGLTWILVIPLETFFAILYCIYVGINQSREWEYITKPLPMLLIIGATAAFIGIYGLTRFRGLILAAFVFSLIADMVLIPDGEIFFLAGLGIFLVAHIMYIIAFIIPPTSGDPYVPVNLFRFIPFAVVGLSIPSYLAYHMISKGTALFLVVAVLIYCGVLSFMGWRTAARIGYPTETRSSQIMALVGVMFFMFSDAVIAFNMFYTRVPLAQVWILPTYWIAQTLIALSLQRRPWDVHSLDGKLFGSLPEKKST